MTEQYIKNPGFEGTSTQFLQIKNDGRGVQKPEGWSVEWYQDNSDENGMTYVADNLNQDGKKWAAKNGKSYFARMRWANSTLYLRQTLRDLKPGKYTLSFSATGYRPKGNSIFNVTVGDKKADINLSTKDEAAWADYNIDFEIAEGQKFATITITADRKDDNFKIGIDDFKLTYDGSSYYPSLISKATSLYNENKDWAKQADELYSAINSNSGKTEIVDINVAIDDIEKAMATFKNANTVDVTAKIVNPNFDSNINGWTCEGGDGNNFQRQTSTQTNFNGGFLEKWKDSGNGSYNQKNFDVYQKLTNLPKGEYTIKAAIMATMQGVKKTAQKYQNKKHGGPYYIDNEHGVWFYGASGETTDMDWANTENKSFVSGAGAEYRTATVKVEDGNLIIGFKGVGSPDGKQLGTYANWIACDNWTLSYFGFDPTTLLAQINTLKGSAEALLNNDEYKNVVGEERKSLSDAKEYTPEETKSALEAAISNLESAISVFTSAKTAYDNYAEEVAVAEKLGLTVEAPATAVAATEALKTLNVEEYNAATKNYTAAIELGEWTTTGATKFNNEHWSGKTSDYLNQIDKDGKGYNSDNWTMTCKQTLTLPAGEYVFKAAGRKSANAFMKLSVKNGETLVGEVSNFPNGNVGLGITTDGTASFDSNDQFANNNNGWGWQWRFVPFTLDADTEITFEIEAGANAIRNWASFGDYTVMAKPSVDASLTVYNQAVEAANAALAVEANSVVTGAERTNLNAALAADKGTTMETIDAATKNIQECTTAFTAAQPKYQALADAKTLEQEELAYASADKYKTFTDSKEKTATTATDAETMANAIISARRAYVESNGKAEGVEGAVDCTSNLQVTVAGEKMPAVSYAELSINSGQGATDSEGNITNKYYDTNGTFWGSDNLKAQMTQNVSGLKSGKYLLTVAARGDASLKNLTLTAGSSSINLPVQTPNNIFGNNWDDYSIETIVDNSGNLNIKIEGQTNKSHAWFSFNNFRLYRLGDLDPVTLDEVADNSIESIEAKVADVTLKRTLKAEKWNTLVLPFAVSADKVKAQFGEGVEVAEYSNTDGEEINFSSTEDIKANVPVLIKPTTVSAENTYTFDGVTLVAGEPKTTGVSYDFVGSYKPYNLATDNYMLYNNQWWKNEEGDNYKVNAFSAYVQATTLEAAKQLTLVIDGKTTGLKLNTVTGNIEGETYNMAGQRVANSYKGLVIKNGKKIIKK